MRVCILLDNCLFGKYLFFWWRIRNVIIGFAQLFWLLTVNYLVKKGESNVIISEKIMEITIMGGKRKG